MSYMSTVVGGKTTGSHVETEKSKWNDGEIMSPDCTFEGAKVDYKLTHQI